MYCLEFFSPEMIHSRVFTHESKRVFNVFSKLFNTFTETKHKSRWNKNSIFGPLRVRDCTNIRYEWITPRYAQHRLRLLHWSWKLKRCVPLFLRTNITVNSKCLALMILILAVLTIDWITGITMIIRFHQILMARSPKCLYESYSIHFTVTTAILSRRCSWPTKSKWIKYLNGFTETLCCSTPLHSYKLRAFASDKNWNSFDPKRNRV